MTETAYHARCFCGWTVTKRSRLARDQAVDSHTIESVSRTVDASIDTEPQPDPAA
jgi:hypothetical protein